MAKKASGKNYVSAGINSNVTPKLLSAIRADRTPEEKHINVQRAWLKGQNPWVTIDNPSKEATRESKIRVKANILWGNPKERMKKMYTMAPTPAQK